MFDRKQYEREQRKIARATKVRGKLNHRAKSGCGKVAYDTRDEAMHVAVTRLMVSSRDQTYLRAYLCPRCEYYHLTHQENRF